MFNILAEVIALKLSIWYKMNHSYGYHDNNHLDNIKFLEINAGPEYMFYIKTASLNAVLFITIVFGAAFPLFYSLALFAIIIQYVVERYTLAVFYRLPPKFSLDLTETNARVMTYAPLWSMGICFWMFGNHQMFSSEQIGMINKFNGPIVSNHTLGSTLYKCVTMDITARETLFLVAFMIILVYFIVQGVVRAADEFMNLMYGKKLEYQESAIPDYFQALRQQDLEELIEEEQTFYDEFNIQNISQKNLQKANNILQQGHQSNMERFITGEPYYQIYKNFDYWLKFNNQNSSEEKNVKLLLCLPMIPV
jgi:hypothetical protein